MADSILPPFGTFSTEGATIGCLLAGYSSLEVGLMNCVQVALGDFDTVLKAMYGHRSESRRISEGERLGLPPYAALGLDAEFQAAVAAMRHCLAIRNQYAHGIWWDDNSGQLAIANMEDISRITTRVNDLAQLNPSHVDSALLDEQEAYFVFVDRALAWVNYEGRFKAGKITRGLPSRPVPPTPPALKL